MRGDKNWQDLAINEMERIPMMDNRELLEMIAERLVMLDIQQQKVGDLVN